MNPPFGADSLAIPAPSQSESNSKLVDRAQSELRAEESDGEHPDLDGILRNVAAIIGSPDGDPDDLLDD